MFVLYCELSSILTFALIYFQINTYTNTTTTERLTFHTPPLSEYSKIKNNWRPYFSCLFELSLSHITHTNTHSHAITPVAALFRGARSLFNNISMLTLTLPYLNEVSIFLLFPLRQLFDVFIFCLWH